MHNTLNHYVKNPLDYLAGVLLGQSALMRRQVGYWCITIILHGLCLALLAFALAPDFSTSLPARWLVVADIAGILGFYGLIRASERFAIAPATLAFAQAAFAIVAIIMAYAISGALRHIALALLIMVLFFCAVTQAPKPSRSLSALAILLLGMASVVMHRSDPALFRSEQELLHIAFAAGTVVLLTFVTNHFNRLLYRLTAQKEELTDMVTRIQLLATHDELTGLPNRAYMHSMLAREAQRHQRESQTLCIAMLDLDLIKRINDCFGRPTGDKVLSKFAHHASSALRTSDVLARWGGEEFFLLMPNTGLQAGMRVLERMRSQIAALDFPDFDHSLRLTFSAGMAALVQGESLPNAIERAVKALHQAKAAGRNTVRFFDADMEAAVTARIQLEHELNEALREQQFRVHYQPQVDAAGLMTGVEALVRWQHPQRGLVLPSEFIPVTEETGLIVPLGYWVLEAACKQLARWGMRAETAHLSISVNVSARQFRHVNFLRRVLGMIDLHDINPRRLRLELTESMLIENIDDTIAKMSVLKTHGVSFSLDDFGTGYSSLSYLKRLPIDELKIDQSFVREVLTDGNDAVIACSIVALARSLGLAVIAEGVESEGQRNFLIENGCLHFQGFLYSEALPVEQCEAFLHRQGLHAVLSPTAPPVVSLR